MKIFLWPAIEQFPTRGGVREHLRQLYKQMQNDDTVELVSNPYEADIYHVESSYTLPSNFPKKPMVYVCHGGFVPSPMLPVVSNLGRADMIISVADWIADKYFPQHAWKTVTIANGVDMTELEQYHRPTNPLGLINYLVYGKEGMYYFDDVIKFAKAVAGLQIIVTAEPDARFEKVSNIYFIGNQTFPTMMEILNQAGALLLTGSEVCPTMLLEAWTLKVPVIAWNADGNVEIMQPFSDDRVIGGALYDSPSAEVVNNVINNRQRLGEEGHERVEALYQWPDLWRKYKSVYARTLESDDGI